MWFVFSAFPDNAMTSFRCSIPIGRRQGAWLTGKQGVKMCPLWPIHIILLYILLLGPLFFLVNGAEALQALSITFGNVTREKLMEGETFHVEFTVSNLPDEAGDYELELTNSDPSVASISSESTFYLNKSFWPGKSFSAAFNLSGHFLGYTDVGARLWGQKSSNASWEVMAASQTTSKVSVVRKQRPIDKAFAYTVAILVSIAFINMGATLDLSIVKETLKRPIGPVIGLCSQFLFMPLCSFVLGLLLFPDYPALQLGLFVTGCSPGGGGSNMWTHLFNGNMNLSIAMTCLSTLATFALLPAWAFTLGRVVFSQNAIVVPYYKIITLAVGLVVPLVVGILIRRYLPRLAQVLVRMLKPMALVIILFIVGFGIYANLFMFRFMGWRVLVAGFCLPFFGYVFGGVISVILRQKTEDVIAIAIETGVQNTGIAIFLLRFTLSQPEADINTVVPVAVAIFTPLPLLVALIVFKVTGRLKGHSRSVDLKADLTTSNSPYILSETSKEKLISAEAITP